MVADRSGIGNCGDGQFPLRSHCLPPCDARRDWAWPFALIVVE